MCERSNAARLRAALEETIIPLMALWLSHGDQFSPEMMAQVLKADVMARDALGKTEGISRANSEEIAAMKEALDKRYK